MDLFTKATISAIVITVVLMLIMLVFSIYDNCLKTNRGTRARFTLLRGITYATITCGITGDSSDSTTYIYSESSHPYTLRYTFDKQTRFLFGKMKQRLFGRPRYTFYKHETNITAIENLYVEESKASVRIYLHNPNGIYVQVRVFPRFVILTACIVFVILEVLTGVFLS
jgi:hypothetical protein